MELKTYTFIDASNLFYGGIRRLVWRIDYEKLSIYLKKKYQVSKIFYYSGVETHGYEVDISSTEEYPVKKLYKYLKKQEARNDKYIEKDFPRVKFLKKIQSFGYILRLKPIKHIKSYDGTVKAKANCDVDLTMDLIRLIDDYDRAIILSGDGDFEILLKYLEENGKSFKVIANTINTAREIRTKYRKDFIDFLVIRDMI